MASGAFQMTDECGRHGDGTNEAVIWGVGLADGRESHAHTEMTRTRSLNITLFLLHKHTRER